MVENIDIRVWKLIYGKKNVIVKKRRTGEKYEAFNWVSEWKNNNNSFQFLCFIQILYINMFTILK